MIQGRLQGSLLRIFRGVSLKRLALLVLALVGLASFAGADMEEAQTATILGNQKASARHFEAALKLYRRALAEDPDYFPALKAMAACYEKMGDERLAIKTYEKYIAANSSDYRTRDYLNQLRGTRVAPEAPVYVAAPTAVPTAVQMPTEVPTAMPTEAPTEAPTALPTEAPTAAPTRKPTFVQMIIKITTEGPTAVPTRVPTEIPALVPTTAPTEGQAEIPVSPQDDNPPPPPSSENPPAPVIETENTAAATPSLPPTPGPATLVPTKVPTEIPTLEPTPVPTALPEAEPAAMRRALPPPPDEAPAPPVIGSPAVEPAVSAAATPEAPEAVTEALLKKMENPEPLGAVDQPRLVKPSHRKPRKVKLPPPPDTEWKAGTSVEVRPLSPTPKVKRPKPRPHKVKTPAASLPKVVLPAHFQAVPEEKSQKVSEPPTDEISPLPAQADSPQVPEAPVIHP